MSHEVFGRGTNQCVRCGRKRGVIRRYQIFMCRQCFRETGNEIGFKKYS